MQCAAPGLEKGALALTASCFLWLPGHKHDVPIWHSTLHDPLSNCPRMPRTNRALERLRQRRANRAAAPTTGGTAAATPSALVSSLVYPPPPARDGSSGGGAGADVRVAVEASAAAGAAGAGAAHGSEEPPGLWAGAGEDVREEARRVERLWVKLAGGEDGGVVQGAAEVEAGAGRMEAGGGGENRGLGGWEVPALLLRNVRKVFPAKVRAVRR